MPPSPPQTSKLTYDAVARPPRRKEILLVHMVGLEHATEKKTSEQTPPRITV